MKFYEALKEVLENGKRMRRPHWDKDLSIGSGLTYLEHYRYRVPVGVLYSLHCLEDLVADDWEIVGEKIKKTQTLWINFYPNGNLHQKVAGHLTRADADAAASSNRVLCKEVTFEWEEEV